MHTTNRASGRSGLLLASALILSALLPSPIAAQEKILVDGSTGTAPLVQALGQAFTAKSGPVVEIGKGLGTKARLEALEAGRIHIAMASHGLKVEEVTKQGMLVLPIAKSAVVFAVHASVPVDQLTATQICSLYASTIRNWKDLGGTDLPVVVYARPDSEVDTEVIRDGIACLKTLQFPPSVKLAERGGDMAKALAETPGAIGVTTATVVEQSKGTLRAIRLDGATPDEPSITAGRYRLTRDAFLVTRKDAPASVQSFLDFVKSPEGAGVIRANGAIAIPR